MVDDVFVGQLMTSDVHTVTLDATVRDVAQAMRMHDINSLVVTESDGSLVGIITSTDVLDCVADGDDVDDDTVGRCMTREVETVQAGDDINDAAELFDEYSVHHAPVVDETNKVIGMLSTTDVANYVGATNPEWV